jgi:hypothetical protein
LSTIGHAWCSDAKKYTLALITDTHNAKPGSLLEVPAENFVRFSTKNLVVVGLGVVKIFVPPPDPRTNLTAIAGS